MGGGGSTKKNQRPHHKNRERDRSKNLLCLSPTKKKEVDCRISITYSHLRLTTSDYPPLMPSGAKNWCFTLNNPVSTLSTEWEHLVYRIYQLEKGENGTPHYQGFASFGKRRTLGQLKLHDPRINWRVARGSPKSNYAYCTKLDTRVDAPIEFGLLDHAAASGKRTDISDAFQKIKDDSKYSTFDYMEDFTGLWLRYPNFIARVRTNREPVSRTAGIHVTLLLGAPGTGKSRYVYTHHPEAFRKPAGSWFDGYEGQTKLLLEDFDSSTLDSQSLLTLLDRYPLSAPVKGSFLSIHASTFFITSNYEPKDWYPDEYQRKHYLLAAIHRRITLVLEFFLDADGKTNVQHWAGPRFFGPDRFHSESDLVELDVFSPLSDVQQYTSLATDVLGQESYPAIPLTPVIDNSLELFAESPNSQGFY